MEANMNSLSLKGYFTINSSRMKLFELYKKQKGSPPVPVVIHQNGKYKDGIAIKEYGAEKHKIKVTDWGPEEGDEQASGMDSDGDGGDGGGDGD